MGILKPHVLMQNVRDEDIDIRNKDLLMRTEVSCLCIERKGRQVFCIMDTDVWETQNQQEI